MIMSELRNGSCYPKALVAVNVALAFIDGVIAVIAFFQLMRIHSRNSQIGWTRQKVFHLLIGTSNVGNFLYFMLTLVAACKSWLCWSHSCGFIVMASPWILFLAAFLLLLSFWMDLCHQSDDDEDDEEEGSGAQETLLNRIKTTNFIGDRRRSCCSFGLGHLGSRQKVVILVAILVFALMLTSAALIWIGVGDSPINSLVVARGKQYAPSFHFAKVYVDCFAVVALLVGGALACYGLVLFSKMRKVRSESASSEMWKVAGLAIVSVLCFMSSSFVALFTNVPLLYHWHLQSVNGFCISLLLVLYYFIGSSVPSAFVLWVMKELPPSSVVNIQDESTIVAFISDNSRTLNSEHWTAATSSQNQISRASPL